jgi:hypothetical protein
MAGCWWSVCSRAAVWLLFSELGVDANEQLRKPVFSSLNAKAPGDSSSLMLWRGNISVGRIAIRAEHHIGMLFVCMGEI